jgi:hypothetical protein
MISQNNPETYNPTDIGLTGTTVAENQPAGTAVGTLSTADPEVGDTFTYALVTGDGSDDNASFTIDGDQLRTTAVFDHETKGSYSIRVKTTDAQGLWFKKVFTITVAPTFRLPDSDQRTCYQAVDPWAEIPCAGTGQDGGYGMNPLSYTDNADGTVTDDNTGLMWQQEDDNLTYNWYQASGTYDATYNPASQDICGSLELGGYTDWRLPSRKELTGIVDYAIPSPGPTIRAPYLPNTETSVYWSSTTVASNPDFAWYVDFSTGAVSYYYRYGTGYVRCVRGGQPEPPGSLVDNADGTVTDGRTGMTWQQDETGAMTWESAFTHCRDLDLGEATDWRLPNIKELESISDDTRSNPTIDAIFFPGAYASGYWSATTYASYPYYAWIVYFDNGFVSSYHKNYALYARCVRGGQSGALGNLNPTDIGLTGTAVAENQPSDTAVGTLSTVDPEAGDTFTYVLVAGDGSDDNASFTIDGDQLRTTAIFDHETKGSYSIRVKTTDSQGLWFKKVFTITVTNVNETPLLDPIGNMTLEEGTTVTGTLAATDPDADTLIWSSTILPSGASLDPATGAFSWAIGYDQAGSYDITFTVTDDGTPNLTDQETITITVTNVNRAPVLDPVGGKSVDENTNLAFTLTATDPDGDTLTYSSTTLPDGATLDPATGAFSWTPGYNQSGSYPITFTVTDNGTPNLTDEETVTITVNNVNRVPTDIDLSGSTVYENQPVGTPVGTLSTTDPDAGDTFTYALVAGGGSDDNASFTVIGDELRTAEVFDAAVRGSYFIRVRTTDAGDLFYEEAFTIDVAPTFRLPDSDQRICYEAVSPYGQIPCAGTGQDGEYVINPLSYVDNDDGTVTDNNTGLVWQQQDDNTTYNWYQASGTYDATYNPGTTNVCGSLTLGGQTDWRLPSKKELMSIVDYAIPPPGPTIATGYFTNTIAYDYWSSTTAASNFGYAWVAYFYDGIVGRSAKGNAFYVRCVRGSQVEQSFIDNGNGTVTDGRTGLAWQQGEPGAMTWGSALGYCEGLDLGEATDWRLPNVKELESLTDDARDNPAIDTAFFPGAIASNYWSSTTYASNPYYAWPVNFHGNIYYSNKTNALYVRCVRGGQSGALGTLAPTDIGLTGTAVAENELTGTAVGTFSTVYPEPGDPFTYALVSGDGSDDNASFTIDGDQLKTAETFDHEVKSSYSIRVKTTDAQGLWFKKVFTITVTNVNEPPVLDPIGNMTLEEGTTVTGTLAAVDPDGDTLTWSSTSLPAGANLNPATGAFTWTIGYDQAGSYDITFTVTDNGTPNLTDQETITITVTNVNRAPVLDPVGNKSVDENTNLAFTLTATDPDGDALTWSSMILPAGATLNATTGEFSWTPGYDQSGSYPITFRVTDDGTPNLTDEEAITITVNNVNRVPVLDPIGDKSVDEDVNLSFTLTASDPDGDGLTWSSTALPDGASLDPATGAFSWTPGYDQAGSYEITFTVTDNGTPNLTDEETITITVTDVNRAPELDAVGDKSVDENSTLAFTLTGSDPDDDGLTFSAAELPDGATLDPVTGEFSWTPGAGQVGSYPITFTLTDDGVPNLSDSEDIAIDVRICADAPSGLISYWRFEEGSGSAAADSIDGNAGTLNGPVWTPGRVGGGLGFDGTNDYVGVAAPEGIPVGNEPRTLTAWIKSRGGNGIHQGIVAYGAFAENQAFFLELRSSSQRLYLTSHTTDISGNAIVSYDQWHFVAVTYDGAEVRLYLDGNLDASGLANYATAPSAILIGSTPGNDGNHGAFNGLIDEPAVYDRALTPQEIAAIHDAGLAGFCPMDREPDVFAFEDLTHAAPATSYISNNITVAGIDYATPVTIASCSGTDCGYSVNGGDWTSEPGKVGNNDLVRVRQTSSASPGVSTGLTLDIGGVLDTYDITTNRPPVAIDDTATTEEDTAVDIDVLVNDLDPDGGTLAIDDVTQGAHGSVAIDGASVTYTPEADWFGDDSFTYTVSDGQGGTDTASVTVTVTSLNDPPVLDAVGDRSVDEGAELAIVLDATDRDSGDTLTYSASGLPDGATWDPDTATFTWTPGYDQAGGYDVTFTVTDDGTPNLDDSETITVTVNNVNRPPMLDPVGNRTVEEGVELVIVLGATDPDTGATLTFSASNLPDGATWDAGTATFTWTPGYDQAGEWPGVRFEVSDGELTDAEEITITVADHDPLLFADDFSDGTASGDPDWLRVNGTWKTVLPASGNRYFASLNKSKTATALVDGFDFRDGRIMSRFKIGKSAINPITGLPYARTVFVVFDRVDATHYRAVKVGQLKSGTWKLSLLQAGDYDGDVKGTKDWATLVGFKVKAWHTLTIDIHDSNLTRVFLDGTLAAEYDFGGFTGGKVGLMTKSTAGYFDDFQVYDGTVLLPE